MDHPLSYVRKTNQRFTNALLPAIVILLVGIILLTQILFLGLFLILIALFALTLREGLEIDFTNRRLRIFTGLFGLRFGEWETLPAFDRITLVPVEVKHSMPGRTNLTTEVSASFMQVRLYPQEPRDYYIASMGQLVTCRSDAEYLSKQFGLIYEDYTM